MPYDAKYLTISGEQHAEQQQTNNTRKNITLVRLLKNLKNIFFITIASTILKSHGYNRHSQGITYKKTAKDKANAIFNSN